jgi:hypothetical protein
MPRVPAPTGNQVQVQQLPDPRIRTRTNATAMGGGLAKGVDAVGAAGSRIAEEERARQWSSWMTEQQTAMAGIQVAADADKAKRKGKNAQNMTKEWLDRFDQETSKAGSRLDETSRAQYQAVANRYRQTLQSNLQRYELGEMDRHHEAQAKALQDNQYALVVGNPYDPMYIAGGIQSAVAAQAARDEATGQPAEVRKQNEMAVRTRFNAGLIAARLDRGDIDGAKVLLEHNGASMHPEAVAEAQKAIEATTRVGQAQQISDRLALEHGSLADARDAMKAMDLDPTLRREVDSQVTREFSLKDRAENERKAADYQGWHDRLTETGGDLTALPADWRGRADAQTEAALERYAAGIAAGRMPQPYSDDYMRQTWMLHNAPDQFMDHANNILAYSDTITRKEMADLIKAQADLREGKRNAFVQGIDSEEQVIAQLLGSVGIDGKSEQGVLFRKELNRAVLAEKETGDGKKRVGPEDVRRLGEALLVDVTLRDQDAWIWKNRDVRRFEMLAERPLALRLSEVPADFSARVRAEAAKKDMALSDRDIVNQYNRIVGRGLFQHGEE